MADLPTDAEFLMRQMTKKLVSVTPKSRNYQAGNPVKDWENQPYRATDPSAGTGEGSSLPPKIEVI